MFNLILIQLKMRFWSRARYGYRITITTLVTVLLIREHLLNIRKQCYIKHDSVQVVYLFEVHLSFLKFKKLFEKVGNYVKQN